MWDECEEESNELGRHAGNKALKMLNANIFKAYIESIQSKKYNLYRVYPSTH